MKQVLFQAHFIDEKAKIQGVHTANQREFEKTKPFHVYNGQERICKMYFHDFCFTDSPSS